MLTSGPTQFSPSLTDEWTPHVNIIFLLPLHSGKGEREPGAPAVAAGEAFLATAVAFPTTACPPAAELARNVEEMGFHFEELHWSKEIAGKDSVANGNHRKVDFVDNGGDGRSWVAGKRTNAPTSSEHPRNERVREVLR